MPSHEALRLREPIGDVVAAQRFDARAHRGAIGLLLFDRAALTLGIGAGGFVGGQALANDVRRRFEVRFDVRLNVGISQQLHPRHARRGVRFAQLGEVADRREAAHLRHQVARLLLIGFLEGGP